MPRSTKRRELLLAGASVAAGLFALEGALRVGGIVTSHASGYAPVNTLDNRRAHGPTNAAGYRDVEHAVVAGGRATRVVVLGDSFTWGVGVEFDDTWPQRLERALRRERGEPVEIVNLSMPGFGTLDEESTLVGTGFAYHPDVVILGYVLNDAEDRNGGEARRAQRWVAERQASPSADWLSHSALWSFIAQRLRAGRENRARLANYRALYREDARGWRDTRRALLDIGGTCRQHGVPLVVAIFPLFGGPLDERYPFVDIHAQVAAAAAAAGAEVVDLLPAYRGLRWDLLVVDGAADEHPNEIANRIAARTVARAVAAVLPAPARTSLP